MNDLQEFFLTKNLNTDEREALSSLLPPPKKFKKGETVYSRDNFLKAVGVVVKGKVTAETCEDERVVMRTLSAGEAFGVSAVFSGVENFVSNVIAADECEIIFLDAQILLKNFENFPQSSWSFCTIHIILCPTIILKGVNYHEKKFTKQSYTFSDTYVFKIT